MVGSLDGILRVFHIEGLLPYKADNLLMEVQMEQPILHVDFGRFSPGSAELQLCILHPRKLSVVQLRGMYTLYTIHSDSVFFEKSWFNISVICVQ